MPIEQPFRGLLRDGQMQGSVLQIGQTIKLVLLHDWDLLLNYRCLNAADDCMLSLLRAAIVVKIFVPVEMLHVLVECMTSEETLLREHTKHM